MPAPEASEQDSSPKVEWTKLGNGRYRCGHVEIEYSEGALRGYVLGVAFAIPTRLVMHVIAGGPVRRTIRS